MSSTPPDPAPLTRLEAEVMAAVWDLGPEPVRVRDVLDAMNAGRSKPLAYNTVQTMLTILLGKGAVERVPGEGRAHRFLAAISRAEATRPHIAHVVERLFGGRIQPLLHQMVGEADLDQADLAELRRWIDNRLQDDEGGAS